MTRKKISIICIVLFILIGVGAYWAIFPGQGEKIVKVSGVVIEPFTRTPVAGVDLVVGDTSIKTSESGRFVFTGVGTQTGIRLTHPELLRALVLLPYTREGGQELEILFNVPLLNALVTIIDFEARGNLDATYEYLIADIQDMVSRQDFEDAHKSIFKEEDITNQEIVIRRMHHTRDYYVREYDVRLREVFEFEVINGAKSKWIRLVKIKEKESSQWKLIF